MADRDEPDDAVVADSWVGQQRDADRYPRFTEPGVGP
jgi:hypothetical protein